MEVVSIIVLFCGRWSDSFNYIDYKMSGLIVEGNIQLSNLRESKDHPFPFNVEGKFVFIPIFALSKGEMTH